MSKEAIGYIQNAKEVLNKSPIEDRRHANDKYVKSACGVAYLGVLKAINDCLLSKGLAKKRIV